MAKLVHVVLTLQQALNLRHAAGNGAEIFENDRRDEMCYRRGMGRLEDAIEKATGQRLVNREAPRQEGDDHA